MARRRGRSGRWQDHGGSRPRLRASRLAQPAANELATAEGRPHPRHPGPDQATLTRAHDQPPKRTPATHATSRCSTPSAHTRCSPARCSLRSRPKAEVGDETRRPAHARSPAQALQGHQLTRVGVMPTARAIDRCRSGYESGCGRREAGGTETPDDWDGNPEEKRARSAPWVPSPRPEACGHSR
jgi:hypothetical protein